MTIPGVDRVVAAALIAETGTDMNVSLSTTWPPREVSARATTTPPTRTRAAGRAKATSTPAPCWIGAALAAIRTKGSYLKEKYCRLKARRRARPLAIGHKILIAAYHILNRRVGYRDLSEAYLDFVAAGLRVY